MTLTMATSPLGEVAEDDRYEDDSDDEDVDEDLHKMGDRNCHQDG